eukprot:7472650-Pyramimonas_sp.AAC.1
MGPYRVWVSEQTAGVRGPGRDLSALAASYAEISDQEFQRLRERAAAADDARVAGSQHPLGMKPSRVDRAGRRRRQAALARAAVDANQHVIQSTDSDRTSRESLDD